VSDDPQASGNLHERFFEEVVGDKGYHSNETMSDFQELEVRTYVSEPNRRGRRSWKGKSQEKAAVYANRRRIRGERGKALLRRRGELLERPFAHCYETGGMRRTHLRGHPKILKRLLVHVAGFNLGLVMRAMFAIGKPRGLQDLSARVFYALLHMIHGLCLAWRRLWHRLTTSDQLYGSTSAA